jgi:4-alpha-glucanotransferase
MPTPLALPRSSGVLLHPTSLPGPFGAGDLGPEAYRWADALAAAGQTWWQILPLNPPGGGDSPYTAFSAFAGNTALLSPELLADDGLLDRADLDRHRRAETDRADFEHVSGFKKFVVRQAWERFRAGKGPAGLKAAFADYSAREAGWLDDYALFAAVRDGLGGRAVHDWPADLLRRVPAALAAVEKQHANEVGMHKFGQFLFDLQWGRLRAYAANKGVRFIGDAPIFVSADSADVWAHRDEFLFDKDGNPIAVAGVPPDYFSPTGQLWGNPLYDWDRMAATGYQWWTARIRRVLDQVDLVRLDHFRGFAAAWHVPPTDKVATNGKWVPGPGRKLFDAIDAALGGLPLIAEDLGVITPDVDALRLGLKLPGMRVLQFAIDKPSNPYWPHNYDPRTVAYTGTHDNDTTAGWYAGLNDRDKWVLGEYLGKRLDNPAWEMIRLAWGSVAVLAVAPAQDLLELGGHARMNVPGVADGNWRWRLRSGQVRADVWDRLRGLTAVFNRLPAEM